ncbi:MAG: DMT family transporter [Candidatus Saccharibacteria bacterium]|nr:DMT family transporter [Pseudorhodobacter sp.]
MIASDNLRGIALMAGSMALFGVEDMFLKFAARDLPAGQILLLTGLFGMAFFGGLARLEGRRTLTRDALHPWVIIRNLGEMVGTYAYITALASVPLATVSAVLQAMPLVVTMGAALFLRETVGWRRWAAIGMGFAGVLIVIRPGLDGFRPAALWVLVAVAGLGLRDLASRGVPAAISSTQISAWGVASVAVRGGGMMPFQTAVLPDLWQTAMLTGAVIFGTVGYWTITQASRTGEVSVVSPFRYSRLIFAIVIGWAVFGEAADVMTLWGSALIIASGLYSFARERHRKRTLSTKPAAR